MHLGSVFIPLRLALDPPQGCVVIFLSYFLALLIKTDVAAQAYIEALGGFLVAINVMLVLAIFWTSWVTVRQFISASDDENHASDKGITICPA